MKSHSIIFCLQLALHDGSSTTFHFAHPEGQARQVRERDSVKEMLQQLLPKFKKKVNKELEERHRMLKDNPGLLQLYKDLVITQIMKPEEFWEQHAPVNGVRAAGSGVPNLKVQSQSGGGGGSGGGSGSGSGSGARQDVGVSGSFLSDIKPQADGANGIKYNLTVDVITSIFKTYPAVKKKHFENVPANMSEQDFWNKFFQSHYFHRDRIHGQGLKDIFTECAKDDDRAIRAQLTEGVGDRFANITAFSDSTIDESYGTGEVTSTGARYGKSEKDAAVGAASAANIVHQNIIKRFNQHSIMVMQATDKAHEQPQLPQQQPTSVQPAQGANEERASCSKRLREMVFEDLDAPPAKKQNSLKLAKVERYLNGPTPASGATSDQYMHVSEVGKSRTDMRRLLSGWESGNSLSSLSAANAVSALVELSPGGTLMKTSRGDALVTQCPDSVRLELRQLYGSLSEVILRVLIILLFSETNSFLMNSRQIPHLLTLFLNFCGVQAFKPT